MLRIWSMCLLSMLAVGVLFESQASADDAPGGEKTYPLGPELQNVPLEELEQAFKDKSAPEGIRMFLAISRGSQMGPGEGWFGPAQKQYSWESAAERFGFNPEEGWARDAFSGREDWFDRLDRNRNGTITVDDFDWSDRNQWVQSAYMVNRLFRKIDPNGNGQLTREEWLAFFDKAVEGNETLTSSGLRDAWLAGMSGGFLPGDAPTKETLLKGLFAGEVGSLQEGPQLGAAAPTFTLKTADGKQTISLADVISEKPVVLVFGNFTCGPFRSMYAEVDEIATRHRDDATFIGVYVREAHPTDGWSMKSNDVVGVSVAQPKTLAERTAVAQQCFQRLKPTIPWLVDDVDDSVGHAYSGMPARLYVIDRGGRVVYKGGRGPFGFKAGEMEQSLVWTLLDQATTPPVAP